MTLPRFDGVGPDVVSLFLENCLVSLVSETC